MAQLVSLEMDDTDKQQFQELQKAMGFAQTEVALVSSKLRGREQQKRQSQLV